MDDVYKAYEQYRTLIDVEAEKDPEEKPYESYYAGRKLLNSLSPDSDRHDIFVKVCLNYQIGVNHRQTNETTEAKKIFEKCLTDLESFYKTPALEDKIGYNSESISALIKSHLLQDLAICKSSLGQTKEAIDDLLISQNLIENACNVDLTKTIDECLCRSSTLAIQQDIRKKCIDAAKLQTVFCLSQAYQQAGDPAKSSNCVLKTLKLQYDQNNYDAGKWAIDCAALSQFFLSNAKYCQSLVCLERSSHMLGILNDGRLNLDEKQADLARCWAKFVINFLEHAAVTKIRAGQLGNAKSLSIPNETPEKADNSIEETFFILPASHKKTIGAVLTEKMLKNPTLVDREVAKKLFKIGLEKARKASVYFSVTNGFVTDAVELAQDISSLYQFYSCFEEDTRVQAKCLKRRFREFQIFIVESDRYSNNTILNAKFYGDYVKQLWNTTAEIFADIMTLKLKLLSRVESHQSTKSLEKSVNQAGLKTIKAIEHFEELFENGKFESDSEIRAYLMILMRKGRTWQKLITYKDTDKKRCMINASECFKKVQEFKNSEQYLREEELKLCREFQQLLPAAATL